MKKPVKQLLFWTPRILCLLFAVFLSLFALDVFGEGETAQALLMHLVPTGVVLLVLAVTWRWEWVGGVLFPALGIWHLIESWGQEHWASHVLISGPLFIVGVLFLINWFYRGEIRG